MNATPPVLPAFIPDAGAAAAAAESQSTPTKSDGNPSFAGTLQDVGARDGRGVVAATARSGETVPPAGNKRPPVAVAPVAVPPVAVPPVAVKPSAPSVNTAPPATPGKTPKQTLKGATGAPSAAVAAGTMEPASAVAAQLSVTAPIAGPSGTASPGGLPADVTGSSSAIAPTESSASDIGAALSPAPASTVGEPADVSAAAGGAAGGAASAASAAGVAGGRAAMAPRQSFKAALPHPVAAPNAVSESDAGDDAQTTTLDAAVDPSTATAAAANANTPAQLAVDGSQAVALTALAESRSTYSAAATDASDGPDALGAAAVAGAALTDASVKSAATATADVVQATLLQGVARTDKHSSDAVGAGGGAGAVAGASGDANVAAGISQSGSGTGAAPDTVATPTVRVAANVDSADFPQDLSSRVSWMVDNNMNGAKLQVNPPSLGPIELRILVSGDHAQVWMSSHSAVTRDALESSTPKLREMLGTQGFSQVSVDISQRSFQERSTYSQPYEQTATGGRSGAAAAAAPVGSTAVRSSLGIVDAYA